MKQINTFFFFLILLLFTGCKKEKINNNNGNTTPSDGYSYYLVGFKSTTADWRDTAFVVRTKNPQLIQEVEAQLSKPVQQRQLVTGAIASGNGGYNKNASHEFKWNLQEDNWRLADLTIEIYDGRPYSDLDRNFDYWLNTVKRYGAWGSYIKRKL